MWVVFLAAGPLTTNDLWWHLAHGRAFLEHGLWSETDPCLATARGGAVPHQWLFAVAARGVEVGLGLHGLRVVHALAVLGIAGLAFAVLRREAGRVAPAACATAVFLVLAWYRLIQLRPELFSILAVLLLERLLFAPALPSWRRVACAVGLIAVWANVHSAFLVGPLLLGAALVGIALRGLAGRVVGPAAGMFDRARFLRLASALGLGLLAALLNPRGLDQHLTFWTSSREGSIWGVADEWAAFAPFSHARTFRTAGERSGVARHRRACCLIFVGSSPSCAGHPLLARARTRARPGRVEPRAAVLSPWQAAWRC